GNRRHGDSAAARPAAPVPCGDPDVPGPGGPHLDGPGGTGAGAAGAGPAVPFPNAAAGPLGQRQDQRDGGSASARELRPLPGRTDTAGAVPQWTVGEPRMFSQALTRPRT